jgi:hypothetical protein
MTRDLYDSEIRKILFLVNRKNPHHGYSLFYAFEEMSALRIYNTVRYSLGFQMRPKSVEVEQGGLRIFRLRAVLGYITVFVASRIRGASRDGRCIIDLFFS